MKKSTKTSQMGALLLIGGLASLSNCSKTTAATSSATADTSVSGAAASSVGGTLANSSSSGTVSLLDRDAPMRRSFLKDFFTAERQALASTACPNLKTASGDGCTNGTNIVDLTYSACSFGSSAATWSGTLAVGTTGIVCGTFPTISNGTLTRQFVDGSGNPSSGTRTSAAGVVTTIDHATANLGNYQGDTIGATIGSGYGSTVTFTSGLRTGVTVNQHVSASTFDHSIVGGPLTVVEATSGGVTTRTVNGNLTTYHNLLKIKGTTAFSSVIYEDSCCGPVSGTITTTFSATSDTPNRVSSVYDGKAETLTVTGCGTGTLASVDGTSATVALGCM